MASEEKNLSCADCGSLKCGRYRGEYPPFCATRGMEPQLKEHSLEILREPDNNALAVAAACNEYEGYCRRTRVEEIMAVAKQIGAKRIGVAACIGLASEARAFARVLRAHGFEVEAIICKAGAIPKTEIGIPAVCEELGRSMCNPVLQALWLNRKKTGFNVALGLCVGHDSLFYKYSEAFVTTLVTKDRVTGHNPVSVLHTLDSYYKKLLRSDPELDFSSIETI